ncbi:MAG: 2-oxo acid dehydrogenase subunit E2 [Gammaproteobacteria bacterium]|nr:2-oxo acid dehydrogenase subunit E2 [Gammaproteobacteria bacterium]MDH3466229.1 2-oxo acid dehydrogenase subunit E2 [Gammaproteobacteria bacterium]
MKIFKLPDLGEGLQEAEIVEWQVQVGDSVGADQPLVTVETDKAVVDVPAPRSGQIAKLYAAVGEIVEVGKPLVEFTDGDDVRSDAGTVVGSVEAGDARIAEKPAALARGKTGIKATPAVRALARRLDVDLTIVSPSGRDSVITKADVERVAKRLAELGPPELLRGPRRTMAQKMAQARSEVAPATIVDDADIHDWAVDTNHTVRLVRAIEAGCVAEPSLNAWFDGYSLGRRLLQKIDVAIAVDTTDGLFVPVLRDVGNRDDDDLRRGLETLKADARARRIPPAEMRAYTITLSNFGMIGGRYAAPVVVPPTVAILGAGRVRDAVVAVDGAATVRRIMPLSLTFDHRAVTGGEAGRFLAAAIESLESS